MAKNEECDCSDGCTGKKLGALFAMVLIAVVIGSAIINYAGIGKGETNQNFYVNSAEVKNSVYVTGTAKTTVSPDTAVLSIGVDAEAKTAAEAQTKNAEVMDKVKKSLADNGVETSDITTSYFYTQPVYKGYYVCPEELPNCTKDDKVWDYKLTGYKTTHSLSIKTTQLDKVGKILDSAADAGANNINDVAFVLADEKQKVIKQQLLTQAIVDAKAQAERVATAAGVKLGKPLVISETGYYPPTPLYYDMNKAVGAAPEAAPSTSISQGTIDVTVTVSATYELQ